MKRKILFGILFGVGLALILAIFTLHSIAIYQTSGGWSWDRMTGGMWDGMMGNNNYNSYYPNNSIANAAIQYLWVGVLASIALLVLGAGGLAYYFTYPQIPLAKAAASSSTPGEASLSAAGSDALPLAESPSTPAPPLREPIQEGRETVSLKRESLNSGPEAEERHAGEEGPDMRVSWPVLMRTSKPDERKVLEVLARHDGKYLQKYIARESGLSKLRTHRIVVRFAERGIVTAARSGNTNEVSLADWLGHPQPKDLLTVERRVPAW